LIFISLKHVDRSYRPAKSYRNPQAPRLPRIMRISAKLLLPSLLILSVPSAGFAAGHATSHRYSHASLHHLSRRTTHSTFRQVSGMPSERATEIQTALIQKGYLTGEPTGVWDASSIAAMQKLQSDNGWQTKITPDSRAIIKLGLGPQTSANSESASTPQD